MPYNEVVKYENKAKKKKKIGGKMNIFSNVLFHIPHNSSRIPAWCKEQFMLSKAAFKKELILMRDSKTKALFSFDKH